MDLFQDRRLVSRYPSGTLLFDKLGFSFSVAFSGEETSSGRGAAPLGGSNHEEVTLILITWRSVSSMLSMC
jgi:hypothetical protein